MMFDLAAIGGQLAKTLLAALKSDSGKVKALAISEAETLAHALARIAGLLAQGEIDREEAAVLVSIQRHASETVLASLAEVSRVTAQQAIGLGFKDILGLIESTIGETLAEAIFRPAA